MALPCAPQGRGTRHYTSAGHTGTDATGQIIEQRPESKTLPQVFTHGDAGRQSPLYISVGYDQFPNDRLYVITVHWLDPRKWEDPWQRSEKKIMTTKFQIINCVLSVWRAERQPRSLTR